MFLFLPSLEWSRSVCIHLVGHFWNRKKAPTTTTMYLFSLLITFIFIWKRIYDNGYYAIPKNAIVFTRNTLTNSLWAKAKKFCHKSHHLSWPLNSHCVFCALCTATNIMIILKWEKLCSKKSVTVHNSKPFLIPPKNIRICGFSSPSIISLLYNRMAKFCSFLSCSRSRSCLLTGNS